MARRSVPVPAGVRPTEARVREALFSIWGARIEGARFLDLFAGCGAIALEAAGRGAELVVAIEGDADVSKNLRQTIDRLGVAVDLRRARLPEGLEGALLGTGAFDLVFADPPYSLPAHAETLARLAPHVAVGGEVALEMSVRSLPPTVASGLEATGERRYGETILRFYRRK